MIFGPFRDRLEKFSNFKEIWGEILPFFAPQDVGQNKLSVLRIISISVEVGALSIPERSVQTQQVWRITYL